MTRFANAGLLRAARLFIVLTAIVVSIGWHIQPRWRMRALGPTIQELKKYRAVNGRFPLSQTDLESALHHDRSALELLLGAEVTYSTDVLHGTDVKYYADATGSWFQLHFNHDCFCDFPDTSRYEYDTLSDSWGSWCD